MSEDELVVYVNQLPAKVDLSAEEVKRAVRAVAESEEIVRGEISVTFVGIPAISALNERHLQQTGPTDVIAFNLGEPDAPIGDIYVCPDVAADSAAQLGIDLREELLRLVVHGALHVAGHDHPQGPERAQSEMFQRQEAILARFL